ncbi:MAG: DUF418 domain-containing protein, partial [Propionibacteriaceae bacterium]|nr:DUF418 domain-containing protein [Propionibacteriaceae bacterium]
MLIAHMAPQGSLLEIPDLLTAPLFALLVSTSMWLDWRHRSTTAQPWLFSQVLRGLTLIVAGELVQPIYDQVVVVLQTLGFLTIVLALVVPLLHARPVISLVIAAVLVDTMPDAMWAARDALPPGGFATWLVDQLLTGDSYRLSTFLPIGLAGLALAHWLHRIHRRPTRTRTLLVLAAALTVLAIGMIAVGRALPGGLVPYSGTQVEVTTSLLLASAVVVWCAWIALVLPAHRRNVVAPLIATGRLALTAYVAQLLLLAFISLRFGVRESWLVLVIVTVALVGFCWAWTRADGPQLLESLLRWQQLVKRPGVRPGDADGASAQGIRSPDWQPVAKTKRNGWEPGDPSPRRAYPEELNLLEHEPETPGTPEVA